MGFWLSFGTGPCISFCRFLRIAPRLGAGVLAPFWHASSPCSLSSFPRCAKSMRKVDAQSDYALNQRSLPSLPSNVSFVHPAGSLGRQVNLRIPFQQESRAFGCRQVAWVRSFLRRRQDLLNACWEFAYDRASDAELPHRSQRGSPIPVLKELHQKRLSSRTARVPPAICLSRPHPAADEICDRHTDMRDPVRREAVN